MADPITDVFVKETSSFTVSPTIPTRVIPSVPGISSGAGQNYSPVDGGSKNYSPLPISGGSRNYTPDTNYSPVGGGDIKVNEPVNPKPSVSSPRPVQELPGYSMPGESPLNSKNPEQIKFSELQRNAEQQNTYSIYTDQFGQKHSYPKGTSEADFINRSNTNTSAMNKGIIAGAIYSQNPKDVRGVIPKDVTVQSGNNFIDNRIFTKPSEAPLNEPLVMTSTPLSSFIKTSESSYVKIPSESEYKRLTSGPLAPDKSYESYTAFGARARDEARAGTLSTVSLNELRSIGRDELATDRAVAFRAELTGGKLSLQQQLGRIAFTGLETIPSEATAIGSELLGNKQLASDLRQDALNRESLKIARIQIAQESGDTLGLVSSAAFDTPVGLAATSIAGGAVLGAGFKAAGLGIKAASIGTKAAPLVKAAEPFAGKALLGTGVVLVGMEGLRLKNVYDTTPLSLPSELTKTGIAFSGLATGYPRGSAAAEKFLASPAKGELGSIIIKQKIGGATFTDASGSYQKAFEELSTKQLIEGVKINKGLPIIERIKGFVERRDIGGVTYPEKGDMYINKNYIDTPRGDEIVLHENVHKLIGQDLIKKDVIKLTDVNIEQLEKDYAKKALEIGKTNEQTDKYFNFVWNNYATVHYPEEILARYAGKFPSEITKPTTETGKILSNAFKEQFAKGNVIEKLTIEPEVYLKKSGTIDITYPRTRIQKFLGKPSITESISIQQEQFRPASSLFAQEGEASLEAGKKLTDMIVVEPGVSGVKGLRGVKASDFGIGETREAVRVEGIEAFKGMASGKDIGKLKIEAQSAIKLEIPKPSSNLFAKEVITIPKQSKIETPKMLSNEAYLQESSNYDLYLRGKSPLNVLSSAPQTPRFPAQRFGTGRAELGDLITLDKLGKFDMSSPKISASISDTTPSITSAVESYRTGYDKIYSSTGKETIGSSSGHFISGLAGLRPVSGRASVSGGLLSMNEAKVKLKTDTTQTFKPLQKEITVVTPRLLNIPRLENIPSTRTFEIPGVIPKTNINLRTEQVLNLRQETRLREEYRLREDFRSGGSGGFGGSGFGSSPGGSGGQPSSGRSGGLGKLPSLRTGKTKKGKGTVGLLSEGFSKALFGKSTFDKSYKGSREILSPSKELSSRGLTLGKIFGLGGVTAKKAFKRSQK